jgi:hypothetical protein
LILRRSRPFQIQKIINNLVKNFRRVNKERTNAENMKGTI